MDKESLGAIMQVDRQAALSTLEVAEKLLDAMIEQQRTKVLRLAREAVPHIGPEDVLNPNDYPELKAHPTFDYQDGILAGLIAAQVALRTEFRAMLYPEPPSGS